MALPTEITSMNSLAAAWEDEVDALNAAQPGRVPQYDIIYDDVTDPESYINAPALAGERTTAVLMKIDNTLDTTVHGSHDVTAADAIGIYGANFQSFVVADDGGSVNNAIAMSPLPPLGEYVVLVISVEDDGGNGKYHRYWTGKGGTVRVDTAFKSILNPPKTRKLCLVRQNPATSKRQHTLSFYWHRLLSHAEIIDLCDNMIVPTKYTLILNDGAYIRDVGVTNFGASLAAGVQKYGETDGYADPNKFGYETVGGVVIPKRADGKLINGATDSGSGFSGLAAIDLASYQIHERYKRLVSADDSGFFNVGAPLVDIEGSLYGTTSKATVNTPLPYQQTYAKNLISYDDNGITRTVLLDKNHVDYAADLSALEGLAGIGTSSFTAANYPDGASVWLYDTENAVDLISQVVSGGSGLSVPITLAANTICKLRVSKPGFTYIDDTVVVGPSGYTDVRGLVEDEIYTQAKGLSGVIDPATEVTEFTPQAGWVDLSIGTLNGQRAYLWSHEISSDLTWMKTDYFRAMFAKSVIQYEFTTDIYVNVLSSVGHNAVVTGGGLTNVSEMPLTYTGSAWQVESPNDFVFSYDSSGTSGGLTEAQLNAAVADIKGADDKDLSQVFDNTPDVNLGTIPDDVTAILADTNELQQNQGNWVTASAFPSAADIWGHASRTLTETAAGSGSAVSSVSLGSVNTTPILTVKGQ